MIRADMLEELIEGTLRLNSHQILIKQVHQEQVKTAPPRESEGPRLASTEPTRPATNNNTNARDLSPSRTGTRTPVMNFC